MKFKSAWAGLITLCGVLYVGVFGAFTDISIFFNAHALALVFGGTMAITMFSYSFGMIHEIFDFLIFGFVFRKPSHETDIILDLLKSIYQNKSPFFDMNKKKYAHSFIKDGIDLLRNPHMNDDEVYDALHIRAEKFRVKYNGYAKVLMNISKYPPALGLLGASTGMIQMMMNLGVGGPEAIGKAMAVALTATFWGIGVANFVFLPLTDYAFQLADDDTQDREVIADAIVKEKEGVAFENLIEILTFKLNPLDQKMVKKEINHFLAIETQRAEAEKEAQKQKEAEAAGTAAFPLDVKEDSANGPKKAS